MLEIQTIKRTINSPSHVDDTACKSHPRHRLWQTYIDQAAQYRRSGRLNKARQKLRQALKEAMHFGEDDRRLATTLVNLIAYEIDATDINMTADEARSLAAQATRVFECCYGKDAENTANCLLNVGVFLEMHELIDEADKALTEAIAILCGQQEQTESVTEVLAHALYNHAALLWNSRASVNRLAPSEVLKLATEAHMLAEPFYRPSNPLLSAMAKLRDEIRDECK